MTPERIVDLARAAVDSRPLADLIPRRYSPRRQEGLKKAIEHGLASADKPAPVRHRSQRLTEAQTRRYRELERRRDQRAAEVQLDPSLLASRGTLLELARGGDEAWTLVLMPWQRELLA